MEILTDRCDACGSQAYVRFNLRALELYLCGHHTNKYGDAMDAAGWEIAIDTRELLMRRPVGAEVG